MARTARLARPHVPLGSLTQRGPARGATCRAAAATRVTRLSMNLPTAPPVEFTSCHRCEHRTWEHGGAGVAPGRPACSTRTRKV